MKERRISEAKGVILIAIGLMALASVIKFDRFDLPWYTSYPNIPPRNLLGVFGAWVGGVNVFLFGRATSVIIPFLILCLGVKFFQQESPRLSIPRILGITVLLLSISSFIGMFNLNNPYLRFYYAGFFGANISVFITNYFSRLGAFIILSTFVILSLALVTEILISSFMLGVLDKVRLITLPFFKAKGRTRIPISTAARSSPLAQGNNGPAVTKRESLIEEDKFVKPMQSGSAALLKPRIQIKPKPQAAEFKAPVKEVKLGDYRLPPLDLLDSPPPLEARQIKEDLEGNARVLEETLDDFGISVKVTDIERGPVITRYELEPAPGVKLNRIVALSDDIALVMKAQSVRIIAPIPGKARVGVEVPNGQSSLVYLKEVLSSKEFQEAESPLTLALGKDIAGHSIVADLDEMPHLMVAGTTGSGKTVCLNSLILSLLFRNSPNDLKLVMVDPKMVELRLFSDIPHMLCPVITDAKKASVALNWVVNEMEERYKLLAKAGARNIESYNEKQEKIPYIIVIIDEFADLMTVAADQIENAVTRLAQLSRAVGIHLILATQRPSVNVITGVIKANLPARISFKVASKVDSRTVLDTNGADKLLGRGDSLFMRPGESKLIRIQGTLVSDEEIEKVVDFIRKQGDPVYDEEILKGQPKGAAGSGDKDEIYDEAVRIIMESNQASVSILQRRLRLGYTRAARIIDNMEQEGLVGPFEGSKPRRILVDRDAWLKQVIDQQQAEQEQKE